MTAKQLTLLIFSFNQSDQGAATMVRRTVLDHLAVAGLLQLEAKLGLTAIFGNRLSLTGES
jgi:hypothetical protein